MRIRKLHPIRDRIQLILILFGVLAVLVVLTKITYENKHYPKQATIETMFKVALEPIGSTMYIWGGGWDGEDATSGGSSTQIGLSAKWEEFAKQQDESYDFNEHRFERENGLDCSGYVGWVLYNTFEKENGLPGYVTLSTDMAESLAQRGWGKLIKNPKTFLPGDIVSMDGHVWICLGMCEDGSVLLVHSSPPGVSVCGTSLQQKKEEIDQESEAVKLATEYMTKYHRKWQENYPNREVNPSYLQNVSVFRWSKSVMSDVEEIQKLRAEEIMGILSPDM